MTISSVFQKNTAPVTAATPGTTSNSQTDSGAALDVVTNRNVTGLNISVVYTGFRALVTVMVDATTDVSESFDLLGTSDGTQWVMSQNSVQSVNGPANITFSIDSSGQIKYTTTSTPGFSKRVLRWVIQVI